LLMPALCNLGAGKLLPENFAIIGTSRAQMTDEEFRSKMSTSIKKFATIKIDPTLWKWFVERMYFVKATFDDSNGCEKLKQRLTEVNQKHQTGGNSLFYMAVPPDSVVKVIEHLAEAD
jgi:glucose-6-phosphate 1-dehydrogenase